MGNSKFNCIAILDAIPDGELNTARKTHEVLLDIKAYEIKGLQTRYFRIETISALKSAISSLETEAISAGLIPCAKT